MPAGGGGGDKSNEVTSKAIVSRVELDMAFMSLSGERIGCLLLWNVTRRSREVRARPGTGCAARCG